MGGLMQSRAEAPSPLSRGQSILGGYTPPPQPDLLEAQAERLLARDLTYDDLPKDYIGQTFNHITKKNLNAFRALAESALGDRRHQNHAYGLLQTGRTIAYGLSPNQVFANPAKRRRLDESTEAFQRRRASATSFGRNTGLRVGLPYADTIRFLDDKRAAVI